MPPRDPNIIKAPKDVKPVRPPLEHDTGYWFKKHYEPSTKYPWLSQWEEEAIRLHDDIRNNPLKYAEVVEEWRSKYDGNRLVCVEGEEMIMSEGTRAMDETIAYLKKKAKDGWKPKKAHFEVSKPFSYAAQIHCYALGKTGGDGHYSPSLVSDARLQAITDSYRSTEKTVGGEIRVHITMDIKKGELTGPSNRVSAFMKKPEGAAECASFGAQTPLHNVLGLVVDDGVPDRGHRKAIFTAEYTVIGAGANLHRMSGINCAFTYSDRVVSQPRDDIDEVFKARRRKMTREDLPADCDGLKTIRPIVCQYCKGESTGVKKWHSPLVDFDADGEPIIERYVHKQCDFCPTCNELMGVAKDDSVTSMDPRDRDHRVRIHRKCEIKTFDMYCELCSGPAPMPGMEPVQQVHLDILGEVFKQYKKDGKLRRKDRDVQLEDYICEKCSKREWGAHSERVRQNVAEAKRKYEEEKNKRHTCIECKKPIEGTPLCVEEEYFHRKCYEARSVGTCIYCKKAIKAMDSTCEEEEGTLHYACVKAWEANGRCPEGEKPKAGSGAKGAKPPEPKPDLCGLCGKEMPFGTRQLFVDGEWIHESCFEKSQESECVHCKKTIGGAEPRLELPNDEGAVHKSCFDEYFKQNVPGATVSKKVCVVCKDEITDASGVMFEGEWHHRPCWDNKNSEPCTYCGKPITDVADKAVMEPDGTFHSDCVKLFLSNGSKPKGATASPSSAASSKPITSSGASSSAPPSSFGSCVYCGEAFKKITDKCTMAPDGDFHNDCIQPYLSGGSKPKAGAGGGSKAPAASAPSSFGTCVYCGEEITKITDKSTMDPDGVFHGDCVKPYLTGGSKPKAGVKTSAPSATSASKPTVDPNATICNFCDKPISGEPVLRADGKAWHKACRNKSQESPCVFCGEMITDVYACASVEGHGKFHNDCIDGYFAGGCKPKAK